LRSPSEGGESGAACSPDSGDNATEIKEPPESANSGETPDGLMAAPV